jgi:phosphoribosylformylglycinamidine cyclo-ligase
MSNEELLSTKLVSGQLLIDALLEPTRLYVKPLLSALEAGLPLCAAAHITGGGITFNLDRALPAGLDAEVCLESWEVPPVIQYVAQAAGLDTFDLLQTFNMGIGLALICEEDAAEAVLTHFGPLGAYRIGRVVKAPEPDKPGKVTYLSSKTT